MRRFGLGMLSIAAVAGAGLAVGSLGSASAGEGGGRHAATFTLLDVATADTVIDADHSGGDSVGDMDVFQSDFLDHGKKVGTVEGFCVTIVVGKLQDCQASGSLAGGDLRSAGRFDLTATTSVLAIVGGTGIYRNVGGQITITTLADGTLSDTFQLRGVEQGR